MSMSYRSGAVREGQIMTAMVHVDPSEDDLTIEWAPDDLGGEQPPTERMCSTCWSYHWEGKPGESDLVFTRTALEKGSDVQRDPPARNVTEITIYLGKDDVSDDE